LKICSKRLLSDCWEWYRKKFQNVVFLWVTESAFTVEIGVGLNSIGFKFENSP
jgi:hypothetical protein